MRAQQEPASLLHLVQGRVSDAFDRTVRWPDADVRIRGRFDARVLATVVMATMVVRANRLVWRSLYRLSETKYRLEGQR